MKNYCLQRLSDQPIIRTEEVRPAVEGFTVLGAFNPAATRFGDEIILLLRVAEGPTLDPSDKGWLHIPVLEEQDGTMQLVVKRFREPDGLHDSRVVMLEGKVYLTSISHLRLARSRDGIHFQIDEKPFLFPARADEAFGIEDARITFLEGEYWITYT
ncbi:MAG: glycosidase, partial [Rudanella sp.]|nr:glycosidase [Rudanella sp.]